VQHNPKHEQKFSHQQKQQTSPNSDAKQQRKSIPRQLNKRHQQTDACVIGSEIPMHCHTIYIREHPGKQSPHKRKWFSNYA
jgi:hypothetical protein